MTRPFRPFLTALSLVAALASSPSAPAQAPEATLVVVGTPAVSPLDGSNWAYLSWMATRPDLLRDRAYAVYSKPGDADAPADYSLLGILTPQIDPGATRLLFNRSRHLGQDLDALQEAVATFFAEYSPGPAVDPEMMFSVLVAESFGSDELFQALTFLGRAHPGAALALGTGFAAPIGPGATTFELRECLPGTTDCTSVIGRVTVLAGEPVVLHAPGAPVEVPNSRESGEVLPLSDVTSHMNLKLRWMSPDALRQQSLLLRGFNVYRVTRAFAEARGWHTCADPLAGIGVIDWRAEVADHFPNVAQVNRLPILPRRYYTNATVSNFVPGNTDFYSQDDNRHNGLAFDDEGQPFDVHNVFLPGAQFYYFSVAEDILGRLGSTSCGTLLRPCDRFPPDAPSRVFVTNTFAFNTGAQTSSQRLRIQWQQVREEDNPVAYYVFRWRSFDDLNALQLEDPLSLPAQYRVAGPIAHDPTRTTLSVVDNVGAFAPQIGENPQYGAPGDDAGRTIWYTVVAVDNSACGGNFSAHSAPGFGVLRDRVAPEGGGGLISIRCCEPKLETPRSADTTVSGPFTQNPDELRFEFSVTRGAENPGELVLAEFWLYNPRSQTEELIAVEPFPTNPLEKLEVKASAARGDYDGPWEVRARVTQSDGRVSNIVTHSFSSTLLRILHRNEYIATRDCRPRIIRGEFPDCAIHEVLTPDGDINPVEIEIEAPVSTQEWRLYRTVDNGPLGLVRQGVFDGPAPNPVFFVVTDLILNPTGARVCYFVQFFDEHGNGGPIKDLGCFNNQGKPPPAPVLARARPLLINDEPHVLLRWFTPPTGIEIFTLDISEDRNRPPEDLSPALNTTNSVIPQDLDSEGVIILYRRFFTGIVGHDFGGNGPEFSVVIPVKDGSNYFVRVRARGTNGLNSQFSNRIEFAWQEPPAVELPEVAWPARPLPDQIEAADWNSLIEPVFLHNQMPGYNRVGVRIGRAPSIRPCTPDVVDPTSPVFYIPAFGAPEDHIFQNGDRNLLPVMLYRYQVANNLFPHVSGEVVQAGPLIEQIAAINANLDSPTTTSPCAAIRIYDPFIASVYSGGSPETPSAWFDLYLLDTLPMTFGARYAYLLAVFDERRELAYIIPAGEVDILPQ
ncbi:MAG: hypothetical protein JJT96_07455 [Opitutales bacterium]|nr:hypothetical protein [Opitutales bacterium]